MQQLQDANDQLQEEVNKAKTDMEQATSDMNLMTDDYTKLKVGIPWLIISSSFLKEFNCSYNFNFGL